MGRIVLITMPVAGVLAVLVASPVKSSVATERTSVRSEVPTPAPADATADGLAETNAVGTGSPGTVEPPPAIERIACLDRCERSMSENRRLAVRRRALLRIEGKNLGGTRRVVFLGTGRSRDNVERRPKSVGSDAVFVRVPNPARSGALRLVRHDGTKSPQSSQSLRILVPGPVFMRPVNGPVSSRFGRRWGRAHEGIDISASTGTVVRATADGKVVQAGWYGGYGRFVCVRHGSLVRSRGRKMDATSCYAHLSAFSTRKGRTVVQGQPIGRVGCTGHCTGPHLHFEIRRDGRARDPLPYLRMRALR